MYVDGFVIPLRKRDIPRYRRIAKIAAKVWMEKGALEYHECVADDLSPATLPPGVPPPFPRMTRLKKGETVVFSWVTYRSRAHRDRVNEAVMNDPRIAASMKDPIPFDMRRMAFGGFKTLVEG